MWPRKKHRSIEEIANIINRYIELTGYEKRELIEDFYVRYCQTDKANNYAKFRFYCPEHECLFEKVLAKISHEDSACWQFCPKCGRERGAAKQRIGEDEFDRRALSLGFRRITEYKLYKNNTTSLELEFIATGLRTVSTRAELQRGRFTPYVKSFFQAAVLAVLQGAIINHVPVTIRPEWLSYKNPRTGAFARLEIDIFYHDLNFGLEVDGDQHEYFIPEIHKTEQDFEDLKKRDKFKNQQYKKVIGHHLLRLKQADIRPYDVFKSASRQKDESSALIERIYQAVLPQLLVIAPNTRVHSLTETIQNLEKDFVRKISLTVPGIEKAKKICTDKGWIFIDVLPVYGYVRDKFHFLVRCNRGHTITKSLGNLKNHGCRECQSEDSRNRQSHSPEVLLRRLKVANFTPISREIEKYKNNKSKIDVTCDICGLKPKNPTTLDHLIKRGCPHCRELAKSKITENL
jgi:hypothetical protein